MARDLQQELTRPAAYGGDVGPVRYLQTHISHLFFAGGLVYKVKKPVDLGFLDFTTLASRRHYCEEEVRLNRRLAAGVYLGVVEVRTTADGHLQVGGDGELVDYAVAMRELPADRMLDALLEAGDVDNEKIRELALVLSEFHRDAATGEDVDAFGAVSAIRRNCEENFEQTECFTGEFGTISKTLHAFLRRRAMAFVDENAARFESRVAGARIREGHGDLHSGNLCMLRDRVVAYDCIEFAARFRCCDVAADLAFLLMDLDLRCFRGFGKYLLHEYVRHSGDRDMGALIDFYKGYRAFVRFKVESMGVRGRDGEERDHARRRAMSYAHLAASYELPNALIVCCGLPGSGKSFAARELSRPFEAAVLNSDATRKRLAGLPVRADGSAPIDAGIYTRDKSAATYDALRDHAETHLHAGRTVIVDAGFRSNAQRQPFRDLAAARGVPFVLVHIATPESVILARLAERETPGTGASRGASDAGVAVYRSLVDRFEAPTEYPPREIVVYDGIASTADLTASVLDRLVDQSPS